MAFIHRITLILILCAFSNSIHAAPPPPCSTEARAQAKKLLAFHVGNDDRIEIDPDVSALASIRNPANKKQQFAVLEVWGHIYKGNYRMRFMYYRPADSCTLMGQEILEFANL
jgi:hypothetical protein